MSRSLTPQLRLLRTRAIKALRIARRPALWRTARHGVLPSVEHTHVPFRSDFRTVVDVGASRGQFASFARNRFPAASIICFEPLPGSRETLATVLDGEAEILPFAVGADTGTAEFHVSAADDSSSLLPIGHRQQQEYPGTEELTKVDVQVVTLASALGDRAIEAPALLKIDVQGFELGVLRGAGAVLDRFDEVFVECSFVELYEGQALADEVIAFLLPLGLRLTGPYGISYGHGGKALQADLLFQRS